MSKKIIWSCKVCDRVLEDAGEYIISSYRLSRDIRGKHCRVCVDCLRSKENFVRVGVRSQL